MKVWIRIIEIIKGKGLRQYMVAARLGMSRQCFSAMQNYSPKVSTLEKIAAVLNVEVIDFFTEKKG